MKTMKVCGAVLLLVTLVSYAHGTESGTMRCNGGIVSIGDSADEVIAKCGKPAYVTKGAGTIEIRTSYRYSDGTNCFYATVDSWMFNFGPNEFQYELLVEAGRGKVYRIESLDKGY